MQSLKKVKRIAYRCREELNATLKIANITSLKDGLQTFQAKLDIQKMNRTGKDEDESIKKHLLNKHKIMIQYFEETFGDFLEKYDYSHSNVHLQKSAYSNCIWVCWWQGLDNAPLIVKTCVESIKRNAGNHKVIILTDDNYQQYINLPDWVEEKRRKGVITKTNYSDLLRLSLLAEHGGMWLDATFFCLDGVNFDDYFREPIWSIKRPDYGHASVACGYFAGYSMACNENNRKAFITIRDFFLYYWKNNNIMIDYLIIDYMIVLAQKYDNSISKNFQKIKPNNPNCDELLKVLNYPFDIEKWNEIKEETALFKLSWKQEYFQENCGKPTFFSYLINGKL